MFYRIGQHSYSDGELIAGKEFAEKIGVTGAAVSKASGGDHPRVDTYENSKGRRCFHLQSGREQFFKNRNPSKVTTATNGQKAMGLTNFGARMVAQQKQGLTKEAVNSGMAPREMTDEEAYDFAESRAKREHFAADMAEMKAAEAAGKLVDKAAAGAKVSELANSIKDRLLALHIKVASAVIGPLEKTLVEGGISSEDARVIISNSHIESVIGEAIRKEIVSACRDIVESERIKLA